MENLDSILAKAKAASYKLAALNTNEKNNILKEISDVLVLNKDKIILDGKINAPEVFKLEFDKNKLVDIDHLIFEDLSN